MIRIYTTGRHAHRSPLCYPALRPLFEDQIRLVDHPSQADLYVFAHVVDIQEAPQEMVADWRARRRPVLLLSEEPFWDTIWGGQPLDPLVYVDTGFGALPVHQLNHHTSDIFHFEHLPYYLLSDHRFAKAYSARFARNATLSRQDWQDRFAARRVDVTFMFERRPEPYHSVKWPQGDIMGLCAWRTELAEACQTGTVERLGQSWQGGVSRLDLQTDWHLDKLTRLEDHCRILGAIENTHQPNYITEKFFDAFACGALPLYHASDTHRIHSLGLPGDSWINLYGKAPQDAAHQLNGVDYPARLEAFVQAQNKLATLFCAADIWDSERKRLKRATRAALETFVD